MIFLLVLALVSVAADELVEEVRNYNCSRVLSDDSATTDPTPTFPTTSFTCWGRYDGYYADTEVDCTIFHYCQTWHFPTGLNETVKWDFACPQSTIFNQKVLSCTPPNISFDCQESPNYYWVNWINLTESTTSSPEYSTPSSNLGQQLIVGGLQQHEAPVSDSEPQEGANVPDKPSPSETVQPQEVPASHLPPQEHNEFSSGKLPADLVSENAPESVHFPL